MASARGPLLHPHAVQLSSVWVAEVACSRRRGTEGQLDNPELSVPFPRGVALIADGLGFRCTVQVTVRIPLTESEVFEGRLRLLAHFSAAEPLSLSVARTFARQQVVYLLWPYARAYFDQLAMMAGFGAPPLPLLLRPDPVG